MVNSLPSTPVSGTTAVALPVSSVVTVMGVMAGVPVRLMVKVAPARGLPLLPSCFCSVMLPCRARLVAVTVRPVPSVGRVSDTLLLPWASWVTVSGLPAASVMPVSTKPLR